MKKKKGEYLKLFGKMATYINLFQATYTINVGGYTGDAGDSLAYHNGQRFSTYDRDNDSSGSNCAQDWKGAWW